MLFAAYFLLGFPGSRLARPSASSGMPSVLSDLAYLYSDLRPLWIRIEGPILCLLSGRKGLSRSNAKYRLLFGTVGFA